MGGYNSGNRYQMKKYRSTEDMLRIQLALIKRLPVGIVQEITWRQGGEIIAVVSVFREVHRVSIGYRNKDRQIQIERISFTSSPCHYGGARQWLQCPQCQRQTTALYGIPFLCRHCHQLAYPTTRMNNLDRVTEKLDKVRERLKWEDGFLNGHGIRPKGMHRKTYRRLVQQHKEIERKIAIEFSKRGFGNIEDWY